LILLVQVGSHLLDVILETHHLLTIEDLPDWLNALGLLLSNLPDKYSEGFGPI
jgi:Mediator complex subunit 23